MKKTTKIFGLLLTLFCLALVTGCTPITETPDMPEEKNYTVTIASGITNGTVKTDKTSAKAGETVKLTVTPNDGYKLENLIVVDSSANPIPTTSNTFTMPESNVTVDATFSEIPKVEYTVTFNTNGGNSVESKTVTYGGKVEKPADPTKAETDTERYSFAYWYTADKPDSAFDFNTEIKADITLYAKWNTTALYSITIASGITNGTVKTDANTYKFAEGDEITLTVEPAEGYELENITVNNGAVSLSGEGNTRTFTMPAGNVTVSATFTEIINEYVIRLFLKVGDSPLVEFGATEQNEKIAIREKIELNQDGKFLWSALKTESELTAYFLGKVRYCFNREGESDYTVSVTPPEGITEYLYSLLENEGVILDRENLEIHLNYNCIY